MTAPFRPCDRCSKPAVVHNTAIVNGVMHEQHLCEEHAAEAGIQVPGASALGPLFAKLAVAATATPRGTKGPTCTRCGMSFADYRQHGLLGCGDCYQAFATTLKVVLERAHGCDAQHVGKAPPRVGEAQRRTALLQQMMKELDEAVRTEQYERAAKLRDQVKALRPGGSGDAPQACTPEAPPAPSRSAPDPIQERDRGE